MLYREVLSVVYS